METSLPWANTGVGDGQAYDDDEWSDWQRKLFSHDRTVQGVIPGYESELEVTNPAGNTIRVSPGAALVDGKIYETDADIDNTITTPGAGSNYYRVVLSKDWAAQTVRVDVLGPDVVSAPTVTQTDGTLWEVSLATIRITSGGTITITDTRRYIGLTMAPGLEAWQSFGQDDWSQTPGTTDWTPASSRIQGGVIRWTGAAAASGSKSITFAKPFKTPPAIFLQAQTSMITQSTVGITTTGFTFSWATTDGSTQTQNDHQWMAIGE